MSPEPDVLWSRLSDLGDAAVLLPVALAVLLVLLTAGARRAALAWAAGLSCCLAAMLVLKLTFHTCGDVLADGQITSPSGHAALSATVYGSLAMLAARRWPGRASGLLIAAATLALVTAIAVSRIEVEAHNPVEVMIGLAVGVACTALFAGLCRSTAAAAAPPRRLAVAALALLLLLQGRHATAEELIIKAATLLRTHIAACR